MQARAKMVDSSTGAKMVDSSTGAKMVDSSTGGSILNRVADPEVAAREDCVSILLRREAASASSALINAGDEVDPSQPFSCKFCGQKFSSFQALGGHTASHSKSRANNKSGLSHKSAVSHRRRYRKVAVSVVGAEKGMHMCSKCPASFDTGQALGGHMRRHVEPGTLRRKREKKDVLAIKMEVEGNNSSSSGRMVFQFDLNLPPPEEEDKEEKNMLTISILKFQSDAV